MNDNENNGASQKKKRGRARMQRPGNNAESVEYTETNDDVKEEYLNDIGNEPIQTTPTSNNQNNKKVENSTENTEQQKTAPPTQETVTPPVVEQQQQSTEPPVEDVKSRPVIDPLLEKDVDTKPYAKGLGTQEIPKGDIPEAKFTPPKNIVDDSAPKQTMQVPKSEPIQPLNAEVSNMTDAEKKAGAEMSVGAIWSGYEKINFFMGLLLTMPPEKRIKMHYDPVNNPSGTLDLQMQVKVAIDGTMVTVNEFYEQYNKDVTELFTVDPAFKARLTPPMLREAVRLGLIMSDKQTILLGFGEDIFTKAVQCFSIKKAMGGFTKSMEEQFAAHKDAMRKNRELQEEEAIRQREQREEFEIHQRGLIDPDTPEGQQRLYEMWRQFEAMKVNDVEKAKAKSDLFRGEATVTPPAKEEVVTPVVNNKPAVHVPVVEYTEAEVIENNPGNPGAETEL